MAVFFLLRSLSLAVCLEMPPKPVCDDAALTWQLCLDRNLTNMAVCGGTTDSPRANFDVCVSEWRKEVGPNVRLRGSGIGEPPPQCAGLACLVQKCLYKTEFNSKICKDAALPFRHCVKQLYGEEYIVD